jgi:predicted RND superfamily exporter protein
MFINDLCAKAGLDKRKTAIVQLATCSILMISAIIFSDFFVCLSILIAIFLPLYLFNVYMVQNIYHAIRTLNLA